MSGTAEKQTPTVFYLDSMTFIFAVEGEPSVSERATALLDALRKHPGSGLTSELTLAEVLVGSKHSLEPLLRRAYLDLVVWSSFINLIPISRNVLYESATLRSAHKRTHGRKLSLPDAIHLVTAIQGGCRYFVSHDDGIEPPADMKKIAFSKDGISEALKVLS
jgi:predicted nucleic acid-binding protein